MRPRSSSRHARCRAPAAPGLGGGSEEGEGGVDVTAGSHEITFRAGPVEIRTRLLDGSYPDYRQLNPERVPEPTPRRQGNRCWVRRGGSGSWCGTNTTPVRLSMRQGGVDLSVVSQEVGEASETVDGDFTGEDLVIASTPRT